MPAYWTGFCLRLVSCSLTGLGAFQLSAAPLALAHPLARFTAPDAEIGDQFGVAVSAHQKTLLVGAFWDDDHGSASGSAYLYDRDTSGTWTFSQKLTAADGAANDWFGVSVAVHGDLAVVGAPLRDEGAANAGAVYLFQRDPAQPLHWLQLQKLTADVPHAEDWFGWRVALNDQLIAVGAYQDDSGGSDAGAVYVFRRQTEDPVHWTQAGKLTAHEAVPGSWLGFSLAVSDNQVLAGAPFDAPNGLSSGAVYLFSCDDENPALWHTARLLPESPALNQQFGWSVALHHDLAAVGARLTDQAAPDGGAVYLFAQAQPSRWSEIDRVTSEDNSLNDWFGESIALQENLLAVGVRLDDDQGDASGAAYLFQPNAGGRWRQTQKVLADDGAAKFRFGESIALTDDSLLVGSYADESQLFGYAKGAAYLFSLESITPTLTVEKFPEGMRVNWTPATLATLESSTDLKNWSSVATGLPPIALPNTSQLQFFRLTQP